MFDTINASLRGLHCVPAVSRHRQAEPVRLVACDPNEIGAQELVQLDEVIPELFLPTNRSAGLFLVTHDYVAANCARTRRVRLAPVPTDCAARCPDARTAYLAERRPGLLSQCPGAILKHFDRGA